MAIAFDSLLKKYRDLAKSERDKGTKFERLIRGYLLTAPMYKALLEKVWMWEDFPFRKDLGGKDRGIDLVGLTYSGEYWAIQCKCFQESDRIAMGEVSTFVTTSGQKFDEGKSRFSLRLFFSTTDKWTHDAHLAAEGQEPPVQRIGLSELRTANVDWGKLEEGVHGEAARKTPHELFGYQKDAVQAASDHFKTADRGWMQMACGTGKTITALRIAEREAGGFAMVLVPSIALVSQMLREWTEQAERPINPICVCSDPNVSRHKVKSTIDEVEESIVDLAVSASTSAKGLVRQFHDFQKNKVQSGNLTVIFSTYHSIGVVAEAQRDFKLPEIGLIVCDEAHRTTGVFGAKPVTKKNKRTGEDELIEKSAFVQVHDQSIIKAKKRLYMTATPRMYKEEAKKDAEAKELLLWSMEDDVNGTYGKRFYRIGFGEAVDLGRLADYKVLVFTVNENNLPPGAWSKGREILAEQRKQLEERRKAGAREGRDVVPEMKNEDIIPKVAGCHSALSKRILFESEEEAERGQRRKDKEPSMMRAVAFCESIPGSKLVKELFMGLPPEMIKPVPESEHGEFVKVDARHVDGSMDALERSSSINWLKEQPAFNTCKVLTNVRCLSEGVDVPALDAVIFLAPKKAEIDIVQSIGRVMRQFKGKEYGYIVIPVFVQMGKAPEDELSNSDKYETVWKILRAIRAHDDRFQAEVDKIRFNGTSGVIQTCSPDRKYPKHEGSEPQDSGTETVENMGTPGVEDRQPKQGELGLTFDEKEWREAIYARIVQKVGTRGKPWQEWAEDVARIAERLVERIGKALDRGGPKVQDAFATFHSDMQNSIDATLTKEGVVEMLAQHIITAPVFEALFENYRFAKENAVSIAMNLFMEQLGEDGALEKADSEEMREFYISVQRRVTGIKNSADRQSVIKDLYNSFFQTAFPRLSGMMGIVYTPVEIVDFILRSADDVLRAEFGRGLTDRDVNVFDPFTGTGTFMARLLESGIIQGKDLQRKYEHELMANDIVLLAYYIACVNIENAYHDVSGVQEYRPFPGIALTDTFLGHDEGAGLKKAALLDENSERVRRQRRKPITVIVGNPPYSAGQRSANDNAQNYDYKSLDAKIAETYVALSDATNNNALYDSYIRAFRYATDRLGDQDGLICFVSNGGWLDGNSTAGFRKKIETEFAKIYVFNLRGNQRTSGELSRREGGKIFGSGSRTPVAITLLVKRAKRTGKAEIWYRDIGDYLSRGDKLATVSRMGTFANPDMGLVRLEPNEYGDWITTRNEAFQTFIPLAAEKKFDRATKSAFVVHSRGMATAKDAWLYNYSRCAVLQNIQSMLDYYHSQLDVAEIDYDATKIGWSGGMLSDRASGRHIAFQKDRVSLALYRPFQKQWLYHGERVIERRYRFDNIYPTADAENRVLCVSSIGDKQIFSCLMSHSIVDLHCVGTSQCFPLYWYEKVKPDHSPSGGQDAREQPLEYGDGSAASNGESEGYVRRDGVSDYILGETRAKYGRGVTKEDVFYYVYGLLHHPKYRETFADDLKKALPRIPLVESGEDFRAFSKAGRELANLHLDYETVPQLPEVKVNVRRNNLRVDDKMRFPKKGQRETILYNDSITVDNIPARAYEYVVNGKSAIEWVMERYQVKVDTDSEIKNDPNLYADEVGKPDYILNLLLSVIAVSVKTVDVVRNLPELSF